MKQAVEDGEGLMCPVCGGVVDWKDGLRCLVCNERVAIPEGWEDE